MKKKNTKNKILLVTIASMVFLVGGYINYKEGHSDKKVLEAKKEELSLNYNELFSNPKKEEDNNLDILIGGKIEFSKELQDKLNKNQEGYNELFSCMNNLCKRSIPIFSLNSYFEKGNIVHKEFCDSLKKQLNLQLINGDKKGIYEQGNKKLFESLDMLKNNDIKVLGLKDNLAEKNYVVIKKNNFKIGVLNYNIEDKVKKDNVFSNYYNSFSLENYEGSLKNLAQNIENIKKQGVTYIIATLNFQETNKNHLKIKKDFSDLGVNLLIEKGNNSNAKNDVLKNTNTLCMENNSDFLSYKNLYSSKADNMNYFIKINLTNKDKATKVNNIKYIPIALYENNNKFKLIPLTKRQEYKDYKIEDIKDINVLENKKENILNSIKRLYN